LELPAWSASTTQLPAWSKVTVEPLIEQVRLVAADIATGTTLLEVSYRSNFTLSNDRFYPVFNELKKWADECNATRENT